MKTEKRTDFLIDGGELDEPSRQVLIICDDLKRHGAIIDEETTLKYYKQRIKHVRSTP